MSVAGAWSPPSPTAMAMSSGCSRTGERRTPLRRSACRPTSVRPERLRLPRSRGQPPFNSSQLTPHTVKGSETYEDNDMQSTGWTM